MSTKRISFAHRVGSTLTDVDNARLSDVTGAFGVRKVSDDTVVVANDTAMMHDGTGLYSYEVTGLTAGDEYEYSVEWEYNGGTKRVERTFTAGLTSSSWHYADQDDVIALIGEANLRLISNVGDDDTSIDTARVQAAGEYADAWMNRRFAQLGYTAPLANTDADTELLVAEANARLTVWKLNQSRITAAVVGKTPTEIAKVIEEHKRMCDEFFRSLTYRTISIVADRTYTRASKAEAYVPDSVTVCGTWCQL